MEQESWNVGEIIWVVLPKKMAIIPARVLELIVRKTLNGTDFTHVIELPIRQGETKSMELQETGGLGFSTLKEAEVYITDKCVAQIKEMCERAQKTNLDFFDMKPEVLAPTQEETTYVELPDGTKARLNLPPELKEVNNG